MTKTITFNELRRIKDRLPDGSTHRIADELGLSVETVRNYFGGYNYKDGKSCGIHIEPGGRTLTYSQYTNQPKNTPAIAPGTISEIKWTPRYTRV